MNAFSSAMLQFLFSTALICIMSTTPPWILIGIKQNWIYLLTTSISTVLRTMDLTVTGGDQPPHFVYWYLCTWSYQRWVSLLKKLSIHDKRSNVEGEGEQLSYDSWNLSDWLFERSLVCNQWEIISQLFKKCCVLLLFTLLFVWILSFKLFCCCQTFLKVYEFPLPSFNSQDVPVCLLNFVF